jgi:aminopeptidase N
MKEIRLADYTPPAFLIDHADLDFDIRDKDTRVHAVLKLRRNPAAKDKKVPLILNGEAQRLLSVKVNGKKLSPGEYKLAPHALVIKNAPSKAVVEIESVNDPHKNTALSGLYAAGPMLVTQCEAEGFRRITFYPDRPDVLATFTTTIHADKKRYPVLLSNGNRIRAGSEGKGRHFVKWEDPFPKPCYLFALVAGKLDKVTDRFITKSGRKVLIEIYVEPGKKKETGFALDAIKKAMRWDEKIYGLEYDLDRFMIVAVSFFNMGAMENKGLNVFNDACVLGRAETATDSDIAFIERVVGHEYFHNWTGDRITCRDWFQLSLKEGLTVFREQEFCGDMDSRALERLKTVWNLRRSQFAEDAGAMAHAIRPASYQAIDNFYTSTVYSKGAEVVRMIQTLIGRKKFRKGMNLYVKRHDGQAATCENFVAAMADANRCDLKQFMLWYSQAGTPVLKVASRYDAKRKEFRLTVNQSCPPTPGQPRKVPMHMPFAVGLLDAKGRDITGTRVLPLRKAREEYVFKNIPAKPVPSLLRDFSAPVHLTYSFTDKELLFLMAHDSDTFNRWEASQKLFMKYLLADAMNHPPPAGGSKSLFCDFGEGSEEAPSPAKTKGLPNSKPGFLLPLPQGERDSFFVPPTFIEALRAVLHDKRMDAATKAMTFSLPSETEHGLALRAQSKLIDPEALYAVRQRVIRNVAAGLADDLWSVFEKLETTLDEKASDGVARGQRSLKNLCLAYLAKTAAHDAVPLAADFVARSSNMTDKIAGLSILVDTSSPLRAKMLDLFEITYKDHPVIMDNWLSVQSSARRPGVLKDVQRLTKHPAFMINNPNRVRALLGSFASNPFGFHAADGGGYRFMGEMIRKIDKLNPHAAAGLAKPFLRWRDYDVKRQKLMKAELTALARHKGLSINCREVVEKSLKG